MSTTTYKFTEFNEGRIKVLKSLFEEAWAANPNGDKNRAWFVFHRLEETRQINGEALRDKYTEYVNYLLPFQNDKFTKSNKVLENFEQFMVTGLYKNEYKSAIKLDPGRDKYLYGI